MLHWRVFCICSCKNVLIMFCKCFEMFCTGLSHTIPLDKMAKPSRECTTKLNWNWTWKLLCLLSNMVYIVDYMILQHNRVYLAFSLHVVVFQENSSSQLCHWIKVKTNYFNLLQVINLLFLNWKYWVWSNTFFTVWNFTE